MFHISKQLSIVTALAVVAAFVGTTNAAIITVGTPATFSTGFDRLPDGIHDFTNAELGGFTASGADKLVVAFSGENHAGGASSVTYGGAGLTEAHRVENGQRVAHIWYLDNPTSDGTLVFDMVNSSANGVGGAIFVLNGTKAGIGAVGSTSVETTADDSLVVFAAVNNSSSNPPNPSGSLTLLASNDSGSSGHGSGYVQVPTSGTTANSSFTGDTIDATAGVEFLAIPEPASLALMGLGGLLIAGRNRKA